MFDRPVAEKLKRMGAKLDRLGADDDAILRLESDSMAGHTCKVLVLDTGDRGSLGRYSSVSAFSRASSQERKYHAFAWRPCWSKSA